MTPDPDVNTAIGSAGMTQAMDTRGYRTDTATVANVRRRSLVRVIALALMAQGVLSIPPALVEPAGESLQD